MKHNYTSYTSLAKYTWGIKYDKKRGNVHSSRKHPPVPLQFSPWLNPFASLRHQQALANNTPITPTPSTQIMTFFTPCGTTMVISDSICLNIPSVTNQNLFPYNGRHNTHTHTHTHTFICAGKLQHETQFPYLAQ
jgi:hypothetical protein